jgi:hypothetical protein
LIIDKTHDLFQLNATVFIPFNLLSFYLVNSKGKLAPRIIKESRKTESLVFPRNHRFFEAFNMKLKKIVPFGIVDHFTDRNKDLFSKKRFALSALEEFQPINLVHLEATLFVWVVSLALPVAAFVVEWIFKCITSIKDIFVFYTIFKHFINILENNPRISDENIQKALKGKSFKSCGKSKVKRNAKKEKQESLPMKEVKVVQQNNALESIDLLYDEIVALDD